MSTIRSNQPLSRRQLLTYGGALTGLAMLSACAAPMLVVQPETTTLETPQTGPGETTMNLHNFTNSPTIVLVHGAFADSSSWNEVIAHLQDRGYRAIAASNPLRSLTGDAESVATLLKSIEGPIVLVGHSYGGLVISKAAAGNENVKALVFAAAFAPEEGENAFALSTRFPGSTLGDSLWPVPLADGSTDLYIQPDKFHGQFAADVAADQTLLMAATQRPVRDVALNEKLTGIPAWKTVPSWFVLSGLDQNIPVAVQRFMAERAKAQEVVEVATSSHAISVSHPAEVADTIELAAAGVASAMYSVPEIYVA